MREYETIYLIKPDLPDDQLTGLKEKFNNAITQGPGHLLSQGDWGKRKLAYNIRKLSHGHYIYLQYLCAGEVVHNLERLLKLDDSILRFLTVQLAKSVNVEERLAEKGEAPVAPDDSLLSRGPEPSRRGGYDRRPRRHDGGGEGYSRGRSEYTPRSDPGEPRQESPRPAAQPPRESPKPSSEPTQKPEESKE